MDFEKPIENNFTIYSKSGCFNCRKVKDLLKSKNINYEIIDCDDYLLEDKEKFLLFIQSHSNIECKTFPMVFCNGHFIGGYTETKRFHENQFMLVKDF
jgi:glutaredoxin